MKSPVSTFTLAIGITALWTTAHAMQSPSWLRPEDTRAIIVAIGAATTTWGALEGVKALVNHFHPKQTNLPEQMNTSQKKVADLQKQVNMLSDNALSGETNLVLHTLCTQYGLIDQQGNFIRKKGGNTEDFFQELNTIKFITQCPQATATLCKQVEALESRVRALEQSTATKPTMPNIQQDELKSLSQYMTLSKSAIETGLSTSNHDQENSQQKKE